MTNSLEYHVYVLQKRVLFKKKTWKKKKKTPAPFVPMKQKNQKRVTTWLSHKRKKFEKIMVNKLTLAEPLKLG